MDIADLENRFTYHPPRDQSQATLYEQVRTLAKVYVLWLNEVLPESREKELAVTHMEDAVMWANAALARHS